MVLFTEHEGEVTAVDISEDGLRVLAGTSAVRNFILPVLLSILHIMLSILLIMFSILLIMLSILLIMLSILSCLYAG